MFDLFSRLFKRDGSSATAKERLRLVLLSDHLSLSPDTVEALKRDLIAVISRYVKVDVGLCDVSFEQQAATVAMHANIPILGMQNERPAVAPPTYAKGEPRRNQASIHSSTGERPYLDDLKVTTPAATMTEADVAHVDAATNEALNSSEHSAPITKPNAPSSAN